MRNGLLIAGLCLALTSCAPGPRPGAPQPAPPKPEDNFVLTVRETAETPEEDTPTYGLIALDGAPAGRTGLSPRSVPKRWGARLAEGNHLLRYEVWDSTGTEPGERRAEDYQPRERFFRVEPGLRTLVELKFRDRGRSHEWDSSREALP